VCGNNRTTCSRKSHSKEGSARGLAGFYRALIGIRENSNQDGDNSTFRSTEDVLEDQNRRRTDNARLMADVVQSPVFARFNPTMNEHLDTKPTAISFASLVAPKVSSKPGLAPPGSPAQRKHGVILEAVRQQHAL